MGYRPTSPSRRVRRMNNRLCSALLSALLPQTMLLADRGHTQIEAGSLVRQQGAWPNITPKRNGKDSICFSPVATRYDKLAANYLAFIKLASIRIWLRANESASSLASSPPRLVSS